MNVITQETLIRQLLELGLMPGGVLLVHTSFSKVKPVEGGPAGLIFALQIALGSAGTLVMPSMSYDDDHPFDKTTSPCPEMGVLANTFWKLPGVMRSDNNHAFAAIGPLAEKILAPHPIDVPHGLNSPVGCVYELDGQVLLLGVGHDANTTIHLAENLAGCDIDARSTLPCSEMESQSASTTVRSIIAAKTLHLSMAGWMSGTCSGTGK